MERRLDRIESQLEKMNEHLIEYNKQLAIHIEATDLNRKQISKLEEEVDFVNGHVHEVQGGMKLLKIVGIIVAIIGGSLGILKATGVI